MPTFYADSTTVERRQRTKIGRRYAVGMHIPRTNFKLAAAVDQALALAQQQGSRAAAHFLEGHGAQLPFICRVLMEPVKRRKPVDLAPPSS